MNEHDTMDKKIESLADFGDIAMPEHLHGKIMKRVFLAGYGKYLFFTGSILVLNLGVLGMDLYRTFSRADASLALRSLRQGFAFSPSYIGSAISTLYSMLPLQSIIATALTVVLSAYIAVVFVRIYRNPHGVKILKA